MPDLVDTLNNGHEPVNNGHEPVEITLRVNPFDVKMGPIPSVVPLFREEGRIFGGGRVVLQERSDALRSKDAERIHAWGNKYYDLADAILTFEDLAKFQADSPLLTGIRGIVRTRDGPYIAVDAEAVSRATKADMRYFKLSASEPVTYGVGDDNISKQARDVVLFRYAEPHYVGLSADQFSSIDAGALKRADFIHGRDMEKAEIIKGEKVIHPVYKALWPAALVVPLVSETFKFTETEYGYGTNIGLYLAEEPQNHTELRALYAGGLDYRSGLYGGSVGVLNGRLVGVAQNGAEGAAKK